MAVPSDAEALRLLVGAPRKLDFSLRMGRRLLLPPLSMDMAGPEAAGSCRGKAVSTLMDGAAQESVQISKNMHEQLVGLRPPAVLSGDLNTLPSCAAQGRHT